jgi:hypothetical protein
MYTLCYSILKVKINNWKGFGDVGWTLIDDAHEIAEFLEYNPLPSHCPLYLH